MPQFIKPGTRIYADMGPGFIFMKRNYPMRLINHGKEYWRRPDIHTNNAECFFSMLRRAERGTYHHIGGGGYLEAYAAEMAWRQDGRRTGTKEVFEELCALAMAPFERQPALPVVPVVRDKIEKPFRAFDFTPSAHLPRSLNVRPAHVVAPTIPPARSKPRRAVVAHRTEAKNKSENKKEIKRALSCVDEELAAIIAKHHMSNWRSRNKK